MNEIFTPALKTKILEEIGRAIKAKAIMLCPIDQGELRSSIDYEVKGDTVIIAARSEHAEKMEYGTPPLKLSKSEKEAVKEWAKRHDANAKGVIWSLENKGIRVGTEKDPAHITSFNRNSYRPFMRPALHQIKAKIPLIVKTIVSRHGNG